MEHAKTFDPAGQAQHCCPVVPVPTEDADRVQIISAPGTPPVVRLRGEDGRWVHLHSRVDPDGEAARLAERIPLRPDALHVVLGAGLGYHVRALRNRVPEAPILIVERNAAVLQAMQRRICMDDRMHLIAATAPAEALATIAALQVRLGGRPVVVMKHPPSLRACPSFYHPVLEALHPPGPSAGLDLLRYTKFRSGSLRVLILHSRYYLLSEIIQALRSLGHDSRPVMLPATEVNVGSGEVLERILQHIAQYRPDFILTVNHLGFDREGILTGLFHDIELPCASWFVDNPVFILEDFEKLRSPYMSLFVWDADYIDDLRRMGFAHVRGLPLATDPGVFRRVSTELNPLRERACPVGFVGSSMTNIIGQCLSEMPDPGRAADLLRTVATQFRVSPARHLADLDLHLNPQDHQEYARLMRCCPGPFTAAVTWVATRMYRMECIAALAGLHPCICGDPGWHGQVSGDTILHPELNYYDELPYFYNVCTVNFNTTSLQMKTGFNQRIFDVPACGAFLLTDYRRQMENVFDPGREVVCYREVGEIPDLIRYYLRSPAARTSIIERARGRIMNAHTYRHRLETLTAAMRNTYG